MCKKILLTFAFLCIQLGTTAVLGCNCEDSCSNCPTTRDANVCDFQCHP